MRHDPPVGTEGTEASTGWAHLHPDAQAAEPLRRATAGGTALSAPWHDSAHPPPGPRTGLRVLAVLGAVVLLVVGLVVAVSVLDDDDEDPVADGGPRLSFTVDAARAPGGDPFGLALGAPVELVEEGFDGEPDRRVEVAVEGVRRVETGGYAGVPDLAPRDGGYLLVDVRVVPVDGPARLGTSDFALRLPDGRALDDVSSDAGWFALWADDVAYDDEAALGRPRTGTLVFDVDLAQVDGALLGAGSGESVATWTLPQGAPPLVAPEQLPGYEP